MALKISILIVMAMVPLSQAIILVDLTCGGSTTSVVVSGGSGSTTTFAFQFAVTVPGAYTIDTCSTGTGSSKNTRLQYSSNSFQNSNTCPGTNNYGETQTKYFATAQTGTAQVKFYHSWSSGRTMQVKLTCTWNTPVLCGTSNLINLVPVNPTNCPNSGTIGGLSDCEDAAIGAMCEADGECGTSNLLENCGFTDDVYTKTALPDDVVVGLCGTDYAMLTPVAVAGCPPPSTLAGMIDCENAAIGAMCEGDTECDTDQNLNNCNGFDVYIKTAASEPSAQPNCTAIKDSMVNPIDGEYTITVNDKNYNVYCYMMDANDANAPYTYITLNNTASDANVAQWVFGNGMVTTHFQKVRFDPTTLRIETGDFTFSNSSSENITSEDYFSATGPGGCTQPLPAAGTTTTDPDLLSVPFGVVGFCNAIREPDNACEYPNFSGLTPKANIDLTGTGLRLIDNPGMDFLYYDDNSRGYGFDTTTGEYTATFADTPPGTTIFSSDNTIMNSHIDDTQNTADPFYGFCKWVTTEAWMGEAALQKTDESEKKASLDARSLAIRSGSGTLCVCADELGNPDCALASCTYDSSSFQLHYYTAATARTCNSTTEYEAQSFTPTSNRQCSLLTVCNASTEYESTAPTNTSDRNCSALTECTDLQYISTNKTFNSDRVCTNLTICDQYISKNETDFSDRECEYFANCTAGEYVTVQPDVITGFVNRECGNCDPFADMFGFSTTINADDCTNVATCNYTLQFDSQVPTATQNRICANLTKCSKFEFTSIPKNETRDRECSPLDKCDPGQFVVVADTEFSNRQCGDCDGTTNYSTTENATTCDLLRVCDDATQYTSANATATSNRNCTDLTNCSESQYISVPTDFFNDQQCASATNCTAGEWVTVNKTATSNRECGDCVPPADYLDDGNFSTTENAYACLVTQNCSFAVQFERVAPTAILDRECEDARVCTLTPKQTEYENASLTITSDRSCRALDECIVDLEYISTNATEYSDRVCTYLTNCTLGQFVTVDFDNYTNRECGACNGVTNYSSIVNAAACNITQNCTGTENEFMPPTTISDRVCSNCTVTQFFDNITSTCVAATTCGGNEFELAVLTPTTDRTCASTTTTTNTPTTLPTYIPTDTPSTFTTSPTYIPTGTLTDTPTTSPTNIPSIQQNNGNQQSQESQSSNSTILIAVIVLIILVAVLIIIVLKKRSIRIPHQHQVVNVAHNPVYAEPNPAPPLYERPHLLNPDYIESFEGFVESAQAHPLTTTTDNYVAMNRRTTLRLTEEQHISIS